jgi:WD40 repeat protein
MAFSTDGRRFAFLYQPSPMDGSTTNSKMTQISYRLVENFEQRDDILRLKTLDDKNMGIQDIAFYKHTEIVVFVGNRGTNDSTSRILYKPLEQFKKIIQAKPLYQNRDRLSIASFQDIFVVGFSEGGFCYIENSNSTGNRIVQLIGHIWGVDSHAFSADGKYLVSGGEDALVRFWDLNKFKSNNSLYSDGDVGAHEHAVTSVAISSDRTKIFSKDSYGTLIMWTINQTEFAE